MKKLTLILMGSIFTCISAYSQTQLNPKIGPTLMNLSNPPEGSSFTGKTGYAIGLDVSGTDFVFFNPGLHYIKTGTELSAGEIKGEIELSYLRLKAKVGFNIINNEEKDFRFQAAVGTNLDILIVAKSDMGIERRNFLPMNGGADITTGVIWKFLSLDVGYNYGIIKVFSESVNEYGDSIELESKLSGFFVQLGGVINVGK